MVVQTTTDDTNFQRNVDKILERAEEQPSLSSHDSLHKEFPDMMSHVWHIADTYELDIPFTNVLLFGPQSCGKTSILERILGFPVAVVKSEIGTTRPMVLTTRKADIEEYKVKGARESYYKSIAKEEIMDWVKNQMDKTGKLPSGGAKISGDRIFIEACGPTYMNRRFVDLPGFQSNDENGRDDILELLRQELENPNTVMVCVEDSKVEYANSNLIIAFNEVLGRNYKEKLAGRCVLVLNKMDYWLMDAGISNQSFVNRISTYVENCGLVPILVGSSIDMENKDLRRSRTEGTAEFEEVVKEYALADQREAKLYSERFGEMALPRALDTCLAEKFRSFKALLGTVDALVISRDSTNAKSMEYELGHIRNGVLTQIRSLERQLQVLLGGDHCRDLHREAKRVVKDLLKNTSEMATDRWGEANAYAATDVGEINEHGSNALDEEKEFIFGDTQGSLMHQNPTAFRGYYNPKRGDPSLDLKVSNEVYSSWNDEMNATVHKLETEHDLGEISGLDQKLLNGQLYTRAFAVWASAVYRLVAPGPDDLRRLRNLLGINPRNIHGDTDRKVKAQRLAEVYINRMAPAINFLCQKVEFLLLKNFDTAWRVLCRSSNSRSSKSRRDFLEAVGREDLKVEVRDQFQKALAEKTEYVYTKIFEDLEVEVLRLFPYANSSASSKGLLFAFPEVSETVAKHKEGLKSMIRQQLRSVFPRDFDEASRTAFMRGIETGSEFLSEASALNPLYFAVLKVVVSELRRERSLNEEGGAWSLTEDIEMLGFIACVYSNCIPGFIETIDARVRGSLWACIDDTDLISDLEESIVETDSIDKAVRKVDDIREKIALLKEKEKEVSHTSKMLTKLVNRNLSLSFHMPIRRKAAPSSGVTHGKTSSSSSHLLGSNRSNGDATMHQGKVVSPAVVPVDRSSPLSSEQGQKRDNGSPLTMASASQAFLVPDLDGNLVDSSYFYGETQLKPNPSTGSNLIEPTTRNNDGTHKPLQHPISPNGVDGYGGSGQRGTSTRRHPPRRPDPY